MKSLKKEITYTLSEFGKSTIKKTASWNYGLNTEIKNKQGKVIQVRQYSKSIDTNDKTLQRKIKYTR